VKRVGVVTAVALLVLCTGTAGARTSKARGRLAAESAALDLSLRRPGLDSSQVGACRRLSADRFTCKGRATGEEFLDCREEVGFKCFYKETRCTFTVRVHRAGYTVLGRIRGLECGTWEEAR
jgi:hypothetical protein